MPEEAETVSVKVTEVPKADGLGDEVRLDVVERALTTWGITLDVEPRSLPEAP